MSALYVIDYKMEGKALQKIVHELDDSLHHWLHRDLEPLISAALSYFGLPEEEQEDGDLIISYVGGLCSQAHIELQFLLG